LTYYRGITYFFPLFQLQEEKTRAIQEKLELSDQKLAQLSKLPEIEEELKQRMDALSQVRSQVRLTQPRKSIDILPSRHVYRILFPNSVTPSTNSVAHSYLNADDSLLIQNL
jgi:hypothetical protein